MSLSQGGVAGQGQESAWSVFQDVDGVVSAMDQVPARVALESQLLLYISICHACRWPSSHTSYVVA